MMFSLLLSVFLFVDIDLEQQISYRRAMFKRVPTVEFAVIQEKWIKDAIKPDDFEQVMSRTDADLLRRLGCEHYRCRAAARDEFGSRGFDSKLRMAIWGSYAKDSEIREFCRSALDSYYLCDLCKGIRYCVVCYGQSSSDACPMCRYSNVCVRCGGIGDFRYVFTDDAMFNNNASRERKLRRLFDDVEETVTNER